MPIAFFDLLDDTGWAPAPLDPHDPRARWSDGRGLAEAPVDVTATLAGRRWCSTQLEPEFGLTGVKLAPGTRVPRHHIDQPVLRIVFAGELEVLTDDGTSRIPAGGFGVIDPGTVHALVAGPDGAVYTECWELDAPATEVVWYPDPAWVPTQS